MSDPFEIAGQVRLVAGRERSLLRRHPWVYRGALASPLPGGSAPLEVLAADGTPLAVALPGGSGGSLALRVVAWPGERWDEAALLARLADAAALRERLALDADAYRLVHAEGDGLPGLVIDRYADVAVVELFEPAWEPLLDPIGRFLTGELRLAAILVRRPFARGGARPLVGAVPPGPVVVREGALRFPVDLRTGQKTGFFLDQRENRRRFGQLAAGRTVLNLFSYSAGFSLVALARGARRAVNVDAAAPALELARAAYRLNEIAAAEEDFVRGDAFEVTRAMLADGARFDAVVVDPPAFVKRRDDLVAGLRGYRDVNLQALRLLAPRGLLFTFSCSALVSEEDFTGAVFAAAIDAGRRVRVLERRGAGPDHPVSLFCPETRHLKALLCLVD